MHSGLLNLYKFISAPIKLSNQNSVTLTINSRAEYLAIDQEQTRGGYLSDQLSNCGTYQGVKHCPSINFFTRNVSSLCLYNVMMMQIDHIRSNCHVFVNPIRQEIHSLGVNRYLLFSPESTNVSKSIR